MYNVGVVCTSLTRKTKLSGNSMFFTIPSQLAQAYDIHNGDLIEIIPLNDGEIKLRKGEKMI